MSRGRLLNRFGNDFEGMYSYHYSNFFLKRYAGIDSSVADHVGRSLIYMLGATISFVTVMYVGGPLSVVVAIVLGSIYYQGSSFGRSLRYTVLINQQWERCAMFISGDLCRLIGLYSYTDKYRETCGDWVCHGIFLLQNLQLTGDLIDSVSRSPLYSMYGETIAGIAVIRAFGASSKFLRDMLRDVDTVRFPLY